MERCSATFGKEIMKLIDNLIAAFVYRPVTMQKVINILLAQYKNQLQKLKEKMRLAMQMKIAMIYSRQLINKKQLKRQ
jgi:hypothetical protein